MKVWFDATRLQVRSRFATPTGIDRVDLAYAEALATAPDLDARLVVVGPLGVRALDPETGAALIADTARRWRRADAAASPAYAALAHWLAAPAGTLRPVATPAPDPSARPLADLLRSMGRLQSLRRRATDPALYVNTSHGRLYRASVARWLEQCGRGGVFFVHDLIPIAHPEYNRAPEAERHRARLRVVAHHARRVIVNSRTTRSALQAWLDGEGLRQPPVEVIPLGVTEAFLEPGLPPPAAVPYFVILGTIEPRKNHALLLQLWSQLAAEQGAAAPRLLVLGRRGWENEAVFRQLDQTPALRHLVAEAVGLSDGEIARLLRGARALLAPSFAEGYGLPVVESLACGTPVLASDLAAHREFAGDYAEYFDPRAGADWLEAIRAYATGHSLRRASRVAALVRYRAPCWRQHCAAALTAIRSAAESQRT